MENNMSIEDVGKNILKDRLGSLEDFSGSLTDMEDDELDKVIEECRENRVLNFGSEKKSNQAKTKKAKRTAKDLLSINPEDLTPSELEQLRKALL
jgi:hypothetical protein